MGHEPAGPTYKREGDDSLDTWSLESIERELRRIDQAKEFNASELPSNLRDAEYNIYRSYGLGGGYNRYSGANLKGFNKPFDPDARRVNWNQWYLPYGTPAFGEKRSGWVSEEEKRRAEMPGSAGRFGSYPAPQVSIGSSGNEFIRGDISIEGIRNEWERPPTHGGPGWSGGVARGGASYDSLFDAYDAAKSAYDAGFEGLVSAGDLVENNEGDPYWIGRLESARSLKRGELSKFKNQYNPQVPVDPSLLERRRGAKAVRRKNSRRGGVASPRRLGVLSVSSSDLGGVI
jgi:hypothetical protein